MRVPMKLYTSARTGWIFAACWDLMITVRLPKEAKVSFVCRKIYQHMFTKEDLAPDIQEYYKGRPQAFPLNEKGEWEPHIVFVGEIKTVTGNE